MVGRNRPVVVIAARRGRGDDIAHAIHSLLAASDSGALFIVATLVAGPGFGITFLGGLRSLSAAIPAAHRAGVMSAFYLTAYGALSLPAIGAGLLVTPLGLRPTFAYFGGAVALLALVVAAQAHLARPAPSRQPA